jgi:hypothetical protein
MLAATSPVRDLPAVADDFGTLAATARSTCENAVDEADIAVMMEVDGLSDATAAGRYGVTDVHELAARLLAAVPTRVPSSPVIVERDRPAVRWRLASRGLLYAAPGVFYLAIAQDIRSRSALMCLLGVTVAGWMVSQVLAVLAHRLLARTGASNTTRVLRRAVAAFLPVAVGVFAAAAPTTGDHVAAVLGAQLVYVVAATVLLFHDADLRLALSLLPGATAATVLLTGVGPAPSGWLPPALAVMSAGATVATACTLRASAPGEHPPSLQYPTRADLAFAAPYAAYGVLCAGAVVFQPLSAAMGPTRPDAPALDLTIVPLVLVMGYAEVEIRRLRGWITACTAASRTLARYRRRVLAHLALVELRVAVVLSVMSAGICAIMWTLNRWDGQAPLRSAAHVALGCALVAGLITCAFGHVRTATASLAVSFGVIVAARALWPPPQPLDLIDLPVACLVLLTGLLIATAHVVRNPINVTG